MNLIEGGVRDDISVAEAMEGTEAVFHLVASVGNKRSIDNPIGDAEINVIGTLKVLAATRREGVRKLVFFFIRRHFRPTEDLTHKRDAL